MSKSLGKILGTNTYQHINKNEANIVPYTRNDGTIGYYLTDSNGNNIYDSSQKDYFRKIQQNIQQQSLKPYDNYMTSEERIENMKQGKNLFLDIENNPDANYNLPWYTIEKYGQDNVNEYLDTIDKYAQKYDYDTYNPEQNIELGVQVIKQIQNSIHNPTPEKVGTVWNRTGAMEVNDFGARTKTIYDNKLWEK